MELTPGEHGNFVGAVLPMKDCPPNPEDLSAGWDAAVSRWLSSPVVWTLIVLILSSIGILRELL